MSTSDSDGAEDYRAVPDLNVGQCRELLRRHGMVSGPAPRIEALGGGVSNIVLAVEDGSRRIVVKQALEQLRVADEWRASRSRVFDEAAALHTAATLTPDSVPAVVFVDEAAYALGIARAPGDWSDWRSLLLDGHVDPSVGAALGSILACWHQGTAGVSDLGRIGSAANFEALRVDPYYRAVARRVPEVADAVLGHAEEMTARHRCLVHGDFSPKNVLVGAGTGQLWVIDFEVAHRGDPTFDVAFLLSHLVLKSLHLPERAEALDTCAREFLDEYERGVADDLRPVRTYLFGHVGALLLARVFGKSPVDYLTDAERSAVSALGRALVLDPPAGLDELIGLRRSACSS